MRDGITHLYLLRVLDTTDNVTYISGLEFLTWNHIHLQHSNLIGIVLHTGIEELHMIATLDRAVYNLEVSNNTTE